MTSASWKSSPQGLKPVYTDGMMEMAELTGGKALLLSNDVAGLVREAMDEPKENYSVTYVPDEGKDDGSFHEIRGVDLRYRPGYMASPARAE